MTGTTPLCRPRSTAPSTTRSKMSALWEELEDLDHLIRLAIRMDSRVRERQRERSYRAAASLTTRTQPPVPYRSLLQGTSPVTSARVPPRSPEVPRKFLKQPEPMELGRARWFSGPVLSILRPGGPFPSARQRAGSTATREILKSLHLSLWYPAQYPPPTPSRSSQPAPSVHGTRPPLDPIPGSFRPLPIPSHPWSHIAMDFVTGLPPSNSNTAVLTIVDRFSKAAHFIALPKLPSARETANLVTLHVFRLHGIPSDIVSDRSPQFISQVWRALCTAMGATVSLSSGYHPQTNGQTEWAN